MMGPCDSQPGNPPSEALCTLAAEVLFNHQQQQLAEQQQKGRVCLSEGL